MHLLLITYHFPPLQTSESIVIGKLFGALSRIKSVKIDVVTVIAEHSNNKIDRDLMQLIPDNITIHRAASFENTIPHRFYTRYFPKCTKNPDNLFTWRFFAQKIIRRLVSKNLYDYIIGGVNPVSTALVSLATNRLKGNYPIIFLINDPVLQNPFMSFVGKFKTNMANIEKKIVRRANLLIFPCQELRDYVLVPYSNIKSVKTSIIPHSFEPALYRDENSIPAFKKASNNKKKITNIISNFPPSTAKKRKYTVAHVGDAATECRNFDILFKSIRYIPPTILEILEIAFYGSISRQVGEYIRGTENVVYNGLVSYTESLKIMQISDALLLVDAAVDRSFYFPGKLPDYMATGRPIIAVTPPDSCISRILANYQAKIITPNDPQGLSQAIIELVEKRCPIVGDTRNQANEYSATNIAKQFYAILESINY